MLSVKRQDIFLIVYLLYLTRSLPTDTRLFDSDDTNDLHLSGTLSMFAVAIIHNYVLAETNIAPFIQNFSVNPLQLNHSKESFVVKGKSSIVILCQ